MVELARTDSTSASPATVGARNGRRYSWDDSALKIGYQTFLLPRSQTARYVQIVGYGNSSALHGCLNSYIDVQLIGRPYFSGNFETGNASQFTDLECHDPTSQFNVVTRPVRQGRYAARFEEAPGDTWDGDGTVRCLAANTTTDEQIGDDYYYSMSFYLPRPISNNLLWETHTRKDNIDLISNPVSVVPHAIVALGTPSTYDQTANRLSYRLETGPAKWSGTGWTGWSYDRPDMVIMQPIPLRTWIDVIVHIKFTESEDGAVQVWARTRSNPWPRTPEVNLEGIPTLQYIPAGLSPTVSSIVHTTTLYDEIGLYKGGARTDRTDVAYVDAFRITGSLAAARAAFGS